VTTTVAKPTTAAGRNQGRSSGRPRKERKLRLGEYPRVSRQGSREDERLKSPDFQRSLMRNVLGSEFELVPYPAEIDVSGGSTVREILDSIIAAIEARELDGIAVAKLDRFARLRPKERIELVSRVEDAGGIIRSASEQLDETTPEGRFTRDLFFGLARMQIEQKSQDWLVAKENAISEGRAIMSVAPFGLEFIESHRLKVVPRDAAVVLELFQKRADGASYNQLCGWFKEQTGREVPPTTIAYMLRNRVYVGELRYGHEVEFVNYEPGFEAIVPLELFEDVQRINARRSSGRGAAVNRAKSLLAGIARCQGCGRGLVRTHTGSKRVADGMRRLHYKCPATSRLCSARAHIPADELEEFVIEKVLVWAGPAADELVEVQVELSTDADRYLAEQRLAQARAALQEHESDVELELEIGKEAYKAGRRARVELVERRERELEEYGEASELEVARTTLRRELAGTGGELNVDERRRLLAVVLEAVVVRKTPYRLAPASERAEVVFRS
jgi:DNA invertase Pin-like site-specific DNA recombinase